MKKSKRTLKLVFLTAFTIIFAAGLICALTFMFKKDKVAVAKSVVCLNDYEQPTESNGISLCSSSNGNSYEDELIGQYGDWYNFTDGQIEVLKEYTSSSSMRRELEECSYNSHNTSYHFSNKREGEASIFKYIPEFVFTNKGRSVFIGQEYGFMAFVKDKIQYIQNEQGDYVLFKNTDDEYYYETEMVIFSLKREMDGREYDCTATRLFGYLKGNICYHYGVLHNDLYVSDYESDYLIADPSFSLTANNMYAKNKFDSDYSENEDDGVSISQVRINYSGYKGQKAKKKFTAANEITTSIIGTQDISQNLSNKSLVDNTDVTGYLFSAGKDLINLGLNVGRAIGKFALADPYIAIALVAFDVGVNVIKAINENQYEFKSCYANNERNILTFPAPSQYLTKEAVATVGINYENKNGYDEDKKEEVKTSLKKHFDNSTPEFVMSKRNHYAQAIFMLSEVNRATVLTSYFNPTFAIHDSSGSEVKKFNIPERFNYSCKTEKIFADSENRQITDNGRQEKVVFGYDQIPVSLAVAEDGSYNLYLDDFLQYVNVRNIFLDKHNLTENRKNELETLGGFYTQTAIPAEGVNKNIRLTVNEITYTPTVELLTIKEKDVAKDEEVDVVYAARLKFENLDLKKDGNNSGVLKLGRCEGNNFIAGGIHRVKSDNKNVETEYEFLGARFTSSLKKNYEEIEPGTCKKIDLNANTYNTYQIYAPETGIYNLNSENTNIKFDVIDGANQVVTLNQSCTDLFMVRGEYYYVTVRNTGTETSTGICFKTVDDVLTFGGGNEISVSASLTNSYNTKFYALDITRNGRYSFEPAGEATLQVFDGNFYGKLYGSSKAFLEEGRYYIALHTDANEANAEVKILFDPMPLKFDANLKTKEFIADNYYVFTPKESGIYTFGVTNKNFAVSIEGEQANAASGYNLVKGERYIVHLSKLTAKYAVTNLTVVYSPADKVTYHREFNKQVVEITTDITGFYHINGENVGLYDEYLTRLDNGSGKSFSATLYAGEKYFIINFGEGVCKVELNGDMLYANSEVKVDGGESVYLKFYAPETGYYKLDAMHSDVANFAVYAYENLPEKIAVPCGSDGYYLTEGKLYYVNGKVNGTDFIKVVNGSITSLPNLAEGNFTEIEFTAGTGYARSFKFQPQQTGNYTFIFSRSLKKEFSINLIGTVYKFDSGSNVLKITKSLQKGGSYEITFNLLSDGEAMLIAGACTEVNNFSVTVDGKVLDGSGAVNIIKIGDYADGVTTTRLNTTLNGYSTKVNYSVLNMPCINGKTYLEIDGNGTLKISNRIPQCTTFAVEVNVGRIKYGDIILDEGITQVVDFIIYVKVEGIVINNVQAATYTQTIHQNEEFNLNAQVQPLNAYKADTLKFYYGDGAQKLATLSTNGNTATVKLTYYAKRGDKIELYAQCEDECIVRIVLTVEIPQIDVYTRADLNNINKTQNAYEVILHSQINTYLPVPDNVGYLKIRGAECNRMDLSYLNIDTKDFTLVLDSVELVSSSYYVIAGQKCNLHIHFIGDVKLRAADSYKHSYDDDDDGVDLSDYLGKTAIYADNLSFTQEGTGKVEIYGGKGASIDEMHSVSNCGGVAVEVRNEFKILNASNIEIVGGAGGTGYVGRAGLPLSTPVQGNAGQNQDGAPGEDGKPGDIGGMGGNGAAAVSCASLYVENSQNVKFVGGDGGQGGHGGTGTNGGTGGKGGSNTSGHDSGTGGKGGTGGQGGQGGLGGNGAVAINVANGNITVVGERIICKAGDGGVGGVGGQGGNGGRGGDGGNDKRISGDEGKGGIGGLGGTGGTGGTGGLCGNVINNSFVNNQTAYNGAGGKGGDGGAGGSGGYRGDTGNKDDGVDEKAPDGETGAQGAYGAQGSK